MHLTGIIAEFNPFHAGHERLINAARKEGGIVIIMSGDFVQRGEPAIFSKYTRAEMALACGADAVIELPALYASGSAEYFAEGAVRMADALKLDTLYFGSECGDLSLLKKEAEILLEEPPLYKSVLQSSQKMGLSFPAAQEKAFKALGVNAGFSPNDILGREYMKALLKLDSQVTPQTLARPKNYHASELTEFPSATALRTAIKDRAPLSGIPAAALEIFERDFKIRGPLFPEDLSAPMYFSLLEKDSFLPFLDINTDLNRRLLALLKDYTAFSDFSRHVKTRNLTEGRVKRALMHVFLGITKTDAENARKDRFAPPVRVLGIKKGSPVFGELSERSRLPLVASARDLSALTAEEKAFFLQSSKATRLYEGLLQEKFHHGYCDEMKKRFLVI